MPNTPIIQETVPWIDSRRDDGHGHPAPGCGAPPYGAALLSQWHRRPASHDLAQLPRILIAREATTTIVSSEIVLSSIISSLAREVSGATSVVLKAVAVE